MTSDSASLAVVGPGDARSGANLRAADAPHLTGETPVVREIAHAMADADAAHRHLRAVFAGSVGLSALEFNALMRVGEGTDLTPKLLATHLDITTGAVTAMTDRMVQAGLVARTPNPGDRRSLLLTLTETGRRARLTMIGQYYDAIARALGAAPDLTVGDITALLERTAEALEETADALAGAPSIRASR